MKTNPTTISGSAAPRSSKHRQASNKPPNGYTTTLILTVASELTFGEAKKLHNARGGTNCCPQGSRGRPHKTPRARIKRRESERESCKKLLLYICLLALYLYISLGLSSAARARAVSHLPLFRLILRASTRVTRGANCTPAPNKALDAKKEY